MTVTLSFMYEESDYVKALRIHYARVLRVKLDIVLALILLIIGLSFWGSPERHWLAVLVVAVAVGFLALLLSVFTIIPILRFRREPKFRDRYELSFSPEGIAFKTLHIDSHLKWDLYSHALVTAHSYILYYGNAAFTLIPTRVFESLEQRQAFENLLDEHLTNITKI